MPPEPSPAELEQELAARLAALDHERAWAASVDPGEPTAGLRPEAAARLHGALEGLARLHARWPSGSRPDDAPRPFGKFLIEGELGRGGHGIVFLAVDPNLNRRVALKIPRPELLDDPDWRRRFLREAHALARLDHPGIAAVLEVGEVDGVCYIASTYSSGENLADWLKGREQTIGPRVAARVAYRIAEAVGHAHAHGVIHRDLKPGNILMPAVEFSNDPDDPSSQPRVTDFGLAKLIEAEAELTRTGVVLGTPRYMAPEQQQARHDLVGPPTDVYAIGVILNEMLIGRRDGCEDSSDGPSPSKAARPRALRAIVGKCLEPEPARRYSDAGRLAADLRRFLNGQRVHAARFSPRAMLARASRHLAIAVAALASALLLAVVFFLGRRTSERPDSPRTVAPEPSAARALANQVEQQKRYVADLQLVAELAPSDLGITTYKLAQARGLLDRYRPHGSEDDLRTWEWYHFQLMLHGERRTLLGHQGSVFHLEYSRDGTRLASSGDDGARVWNVTTGAPELTLREHKGTVTWVAFSPEGTRLATTSDDQTVRVWSAADGRRLLPPLVHQHKVVVVLFTPDGRRLVSCDRGAIITTWNSTTGALIGSHKVADEPLEGMDLSPDGSTLAVAASHEVTLWDYPAMHRRTFRVPRENLPERFDCVAFSHDGRTFATSGGAASRQIQLWEAQTGRLDHSFTHHADERVMTVAFSPDDRLLLSTAVDESARIWDLAQGGCVGILAGHDAWVWSGGFTPDGKSVATGDGHGAIKLWDIPQRGAMTRFELASHTCAAIAYSSDGRSVYTAIRGGGLLAWDVATCQKRGSLRFRPEKPSLHAAFAPGAGLVAAADAEGTLSIGSPLEERPLITLPRAASSHPCLTFSDNGRSLAFVAANGSLARLDLSARDPRTVALGSLPTAPTSLAVATDGSVLAGGADGRLFAQDENAGLATEAAERGNQGPITCLALSPDQTLCATGGEDASIVLWDRQTLRVRSRMKGRQQPIDALAFTADGRTLIAASERVRIQFWNVATGQRTITYDDLAGQSRLPVHLAVSPDGSSITAMVNERDSAHGLVWHSAPAGSE